MQEIRLKSNYRCKYPNTNPLGKCKLRKKGLCYTDCINYGVCGGCYYYNINSKHEKCMNCKFNEDIKNDPNLIEINDDAENALIKAVKEKDGYINGNNIKL